MLPPARSPGRTTRLSPQLNCGIGSGRFRDDPVCLYDPGSAIRRRERPGSETATRQASTTMTKPNTAIPRVMAVVALIAAVVAVILVVGSVTGNGEDSPTKPHRAAPGKKEARKPKTKARTYEVKEGDNLSLIAERTGVPVDRIERLNPDLDPQAITIGQKIKLR